MNRWAALILLAASAAVAQEPRFDVASVKALPGRPKPGGDIEVRPTGVRMSGFPLGAIIRWAYGLHPYQQGFEISGPTWLDPGLGCIYYDIEGKTEQSVPVEQIRRMLRTLLADRFQLVLHREHKEIVACVISTAKTGPKLQSSEETAMTVSPEGSVLHFRGAALSRLDEWLYSWVPYLMLDEPASPGATISI